jgi:uncharacterized protein (DUF983 family)
MRSEPAMLGPAPAPLVAGLRCCCPRCGQGALFAGYLTLRARCAVCGLDFSRSDSADGPAVFLIFILGALTVGLAIWVEVTFTPPLWLHVLIWPVFVLALALALLRPAKAYVVALQYRYRASEFDDT